MSTPEHNDAPAADDNWEVLPPSQAAEEVESNAVAEAAAAADADDEEPRTASAGTASDGDGNGEGWSEGVSLEEACPALINPNYFGVPVSVEVPSESDSPVAERVASPGWIEPEPTPTPMPAVSAEPLPETEMASSESDGDGARVSDEVSVVSGGDGDGAEVAEDRQDSGGEVSKGLFGGFLWWSGIPASWWKGKAIWSVAVAAALTGIVILGRRWYRLRSLRNNKKKVSLRVTAHDKQLAQLLYHFIGLNETLSIARRVPVPAPTSFVGPVSSSTSLVGCQQVV